MGGLNGSIVGNYNYLGVYQSATTFTVFLGNGDGTYAAPNNVGVNYVGSLA